MTIIDPIPVEAPYGAADWKDYKHNWREVDTDWIQDRSILRFATATQRDQKLLSPQVGQFIYNNTTDALEYRSKTNAWKPYKPGPAYLETVTDTTTTVKLSQSGAGSKGLTFSSTGMSSDTTFAINGGILTVTDTAVTIKTGTKTASLTTDATYLISDTPISVPSIALTGTGTVLTAAGKTISVGTLAATSVTTGTLSATGAITGGNASNIGGVIFQDGYPNAVSGYASQAGYFYGGSTSAVMRYRNPSGGALGAAYFQVTEDNFVTSGGYTDIYATPRIFGDRSTLYYGAAGFLGYAGPVIYSGSALSAANYPNGTIWVQP